MTQALTQEQIQAGLKKNPEWHLNEKGEITYQVKAKDFAHALLLVNAVGLFAEGMNHHPDILIQYNRVTFNLITHDAKGLTQKDFSLAAKTSELARSSTQSS